MSTILVIDDPPIVREVVVRYLERDGFRTLEGSSGEPLGLDVVLALARPGEDPSSRRHTQQVVRADAAAVTRQI